MDTGWIVGLQDVAPDSGATEVKAGCLRASLLEVDERASRRRAHVRPCRRALLVPIGEPVSYRIPLVPNALRCLAGHRIDLVSRRRSAQHSTRDHGLSPSPVGRSWTQRRLLDLAPASACHLDGDPVTWTPLVTLAASSPRGNRRRPRPNQRAGVTRRWTTAAPPVSRRSEAAVCPESELDGPRFGWRPALIAAPLLDAG